MSSGNYTDAFRRDVVELKQSTPGLSVRRLEEIIGVRHGTAKRWLDSFADQDSEPEPDAMSLRDAVLARGTGIDDTSAFDVALGLARLGPLRRAVQVGEQIEECRKAIGDLRGQLDTADPTSPVIGWVHDHLDQLVTEIAVIVDNGGRAPRAVDAAPEEPLFEVTAAMAAPYPLSVGELLQDASYSARQLLVAPSVLRAQGMVTGWVRAVVTASRLLEALPEAAVHPPPGNRRFLDTFAHRASGFAQSASGRSWPADDAADIGMMTLTRNLRDATNILRTQPDHDPVLLEEIDDVRACRFTAIQTVYVATHAVGVTLDAFLAEADAPSVPGHGRGRAAQGWRPKVESFERFLHAELQGETRPGPMRDSVDDGCARLEVALAAWETEVGRVLAEHPGPRTLGMIAQVQSLIVESTTSAVTAGLPSSGPVDVDRVARAGDQARDAWQRLANGWFELSSHREIPDESIVLVGREVRTACHTRSDSSRSTGSGPTEDTVERASVFLSAVNAGVDIAARLQHASEDARLRAPARQVMRLNEHEANRLGVTYHAYIAPGSIRDDKLVRLPLLVSRALARAGYEATVHAEALASAIHPRDATNMAARHGAVLQRAVLAAPVVQGSAPEAAAQQAPSPARDTAEPAYGR